jgi:predicted permease
MPRRAGQPASGQNIRRRREVAVRLALGVSRRRLLAESVAGSVLLALAGGVVAYGLERWAGGVVQRLLLPSVFFPRAEAETRILIYTGAVALLVGFVAAVAPALATARTTLLAAMNDGSPWAARGRSRPLGALVVLQAAVSVTLLVGAGLFMRSLVQVRSLGWGVDLERVVLARIEWQTGVDALRQDEVTADLIGRLAGVPGVESAAGAADFAFGTPLRGAVESPGLDLSTESAPVVHYVTPDYFRTVGLDLLDGRALLGTDGPDDPPVAVVSRTMADQLWPGDDAIGRCFVLRGGASDACTTVVGVAEDASRGLIAQEDFLALYLPLAQTGGYGAIYVRAAGDAGELASRVSIFLRSASPQVRYASAETLRNVLEPQLRSWTLGAWLFSVFGALALLVASVGLYSVLAYEAAARTREIGIRSALGAGAGRLLAGVLLTGAREVGVGVVLGRLGAYLAAPRIADLLFDVPARDPWVMGGVAAALLAVAALASLLPALRTARIDPARVLRRE